MDYNNSQKQYSQATSAMPADYMTANDYDQAVDPSVPLVPVASAPKDETLYDSLMRYHNENDSTSTEESGARRKSNPKVSPYHQHLGEKGSNYLLQGKSGSSRDDGDDDDDGDTMLEDRKLPARPVATKAAPPIQTAPTAVAGVNVNQKAPPPSLTAVVGRKPAPSTAAPMSKTVPAMAIETDAGGNRNAAGASPLLKDFKQGSFYKAALEAAEGGAMENGTKRPGVFQVNEPGMRTSSAMYQAAYGNQQHSQPPPPPQQQQQQQQQQNMTSFQRAEDTKRQGTTFPGPTAATEFEKQPQPFSVRSRANSSLSQSSHTPRMNTAPSRNRTSDGGSIPSVAVLPPDLLRAYSSGGYSSVSSNPPEHMMNIGNDDHMGLPNVLRNAPNNKRNTKVSPKRNPAASTSAAKNTRPTMESQPSRQTPYDETVGSGMVVPNFGGPRHGTTPGADVPRAPTGMMPTLGPPVFNSGMNNSLNSRSTHSAMTPVEYNSRPGMTGGANFQPSGLPTSYGYPKPAGSNVGPRLGIQRGVRPLPYPSVEETSVTEQSHSTAESSMDDELRLALEISKRETGAPKTGLGYPGVGNGPQDFNPRTVARSPDSSMNRGKKSPPPTSMGRPNQHFQKQSSFTRDAMAQAHRESSNSSLSDLLLALKLSAEESGVAAYPGTPEMGRRTSTSLDELLAFELAQNTTQNMTDFVAAGITAAPGPNTMRTSPNSSTSMSSIPKGGRPWPASSGDPDEQYLILERIREEQEQRELEMALKASEQESKNNQSTPGAVRMNQPAPNRSYLHSQQKAMEDWRKPGFSTSPQPSSTAGPFSSSGSGGHKQRPRTQRENSLSSIDSEGRRRELLERGTSETQQAIQTGQAHVVICRGCGGRLQAPVSYSLVYCPKCHTISPA